MFSAACVLVAGRALAVAIKLRGEQALEMKGAARGKANGTRHELRNAAATVMEMIR
jgi:hypothetical protein